MKIILWCILIFGLTGCATEKLKDDFFWRNQKILDAKATGTNKGEFGEFPEGYISISNEHFGKYVSAYTKPYPYIRKNGDKGYMACVIDRENNLSIVFMRGNELIDSSKLTSFPTNDTNTICNTYKRYDDKEFDNASYQNKKFADNQNKIKLAEIEFNYRKKLPELINNNSQQHLFGDAETAKNIVLNHLKYKLKDFNSAIIEFQSVSKSVVADKKTLNPIYGYEIKININAKNSYGGYGGFTKWGFFVSDGEIVKYM